MIIRFFVYLNQRTISLTWSGTIRRPLVAWIISSTLTPGALSTSRKPSGVTSKTPRSLTIFLTQATPVSGNVQDGNNLELTHGINGIRNTAKNKIQEIVGGRKDYKIDCLAAEFKDWEISW